jgi:chemotaxis signal transduction protein
VRGNLVPFLRLRDLFGTPGSPDRHQKTIIISTGETRVGLVADRIMGTHQTVIKSLSKLHADVIIDVAQLVVLAQAQSEKQQINEAAKMNRDYGHDVATTYDDAAMQVVMVGLGDEKFALDAGLVREIIDLFLPRRLRVRGHSSRASSMFAATSFRSPTCASALEAHQR